MQDRTESSRQVISLKFPLKRSRFSFPPINHHDDRQRRLIIRQIESSFSAYGSALADVRARAEEAALLIHRGSPFIQEHTASVCPSCVRVCCVNRHSYHETEDIVLLYALGFKVPPYQEGIDDSDPCRFLDERGCAVPRRLRPHRCNWYFCTPLLHHIREAPGREYRAFVAMLAQMTDTRAKMLQAFTDAVETVPGLWEAWHFQ
ncbi:MAG TPA: hypothetical protein VF790_12820 [Dissulfurispiraceae bacterium]